MSGHLETAATKGKRRWQGPMAIDTGGFVSSFDSVGFNRTRDMSGRWSGQGRVGAGSKCLWYCQRNFSVGTDPKILTDSAWKIKKEIFTAVIKTPLLPGDFSSLSDFISFPSLPLSPLSTLSSTPRFCYYILTPGTWEQASWSNTHPMSSGVSHHKLSLSLCLAGLTPSVNTCGCVWSRLLLHYSNEERADALAWYLHYVVGWEGRRRITPPRLNLFQGVAGFQIPASLLDVQKPPFNSEKISLFSGNTGAWFLVQRHLLEVGREGCALLWKSRIELLSAHCIVWGD